MGLVVEKKFQRTVQASDLELSSASQRCSPLSDRDTFHILTPRLAIGKRIAALKSAQKTKSNEIVKSQSGVILRYETFFFFPRKIIVNLILRGVFSGTNGFQIGTP